MSPRIVRPPVVDGAPVDAKGWPIVLLARVYVPPRESSLVKGHMVAAFAGIVEAIQKDEFWGSHIIEVRDFKNWNVRNVLPGDCIMQKGKTQTSEADEAARDAVKRRGNGRPKRTRPPRK